MKQQWKRLSIGLNHVLVSSYNSNGAQRGVCGEEYHIVCIRIINDGVAMSIMQYVEGISRLDDQ